MWSLQALITFAAWIWQFDGPECESREHSDGPLDTSR